MALTLTRRELESIRIGDDIEVHVSRIHGGKVRLSITAPDNIKVMRTEIISSASQRQHKLLNWLRRCWQ